MVQWFRFCLPNAGDMGSIPGQGTKIPHSVEHLSLGAITRERLGVAIKTQHSQKKEKKTKPCIPIITTPKSAMLQNLGFFVSTALKRLFTAFTTYKAKDKNYSYKF